MNPFISGRPWILDGGFATELEKLGFDAKQKLWSARALLDAPELVKEVHRKFLQAGAEIILTSTYQASHHEFQAELNLNETQIQNLYNLSLKVAHQAVEEFRSKFPDRRHLIGASIGPYGATLADGSEYKGTYKLNSDVEEYYRKKISSILNVQTSMHPDFLAFETIPSVEEGLFIIKMLSEFPDARAWISFSRLDHPQKLKTFDNHSQLWAVGCNCVHPDQVSDILKTLNGVSDLPKVVYPNKGAQYDPTKKKWSPENQLNWNSTVPIWLSLGARVIGGCCQVGPEDIALLVAQSFWGN